MSDIQEARVMLERAIDEREWAYAAEALEMLAEADDE